MSDSESVLCLKSQHILLHKLHTYSTRRIWIRFQPEVDFIQIQYGQKMSDSGSVFYVYKSQHNLMVKHTFHKNGLDPPPAAS